MIVKVGVREFDLDGFQYKEVLRSEKFLSWVKHLDPQIELRSVKVEWVRFTKKGLLFAVISCEMYLNGKQVLPGLVVLSGDAVVILPVFTAEELGDKWVLLVLQPRGPMGKAAMLEAIAGRVEDGEDPKEVACREAAEEALITVTKEEVIDLGSTIPSAGLKAETLYLFAVEKTLPITEISLLEGKLAGLEEEGEVIKTKIIALDHLMLKIENHMIDDAKLELAVTRYLKYLEGKDTEE